MEPWPPRHRTAAFFDLDKTIIAKSSTLAFSKPFQAGGLISRRAVLRSAYAQFVYLVGGADHDQMEKMRQFMSQLVRRLGRRHGARDRRRHAAQHRRPARLRRGGHPDRGAPARRPRRRHRLHVSGTEVVEPIGEMLGADHVIATRLEDRRRQVHRRDRLLRVRRGEGPRDPRAGRASAATTSSGSYAYSDSVTDVPMLEVVGHPHAVNPDKELRKVAAAAGAGRSWSSPSRSPCAAGCRPSRPWPRSRSAAWSRSAACSGPTRAAGASAPERRGPSPSPTSRGFETGAERPPQPPWLTSPPLPPRDDGARVMRGADRASDGPRDAISAAWRGHTQRNQAGSSRPRHGVACRRGDRPTAGPPNPVPRVQTQTCPSHAGGTRGAKPRMPPLTREPGYQACNI